MQRKSVSERCQKGFESTAVRDAEKLSRLIFEFCKENDIQDASIVTDLLWKVYEMGFDSGISSVRIIHDNMKGFRI